MRIFATIVKRDDEKRMVYGYASTEALDSQGERVSKDALAKALPDYMRFANIREMHQPSAVGVAKEATMDDKGLYLCAKVVDDDAWKKVTEEVYKGFSIGGKVVSKVDETITELKLSEISLVDRPANPEAVIEVWKADWASDAEQGAVDELAKLMQGGLAASEVLALAKRAIVERDERAAALADGSFRIVEKRQLRAALLALPLAKDHRATIAHIVKRADALGLKDAVPASWRVAPVAKGLYTVAQFAQLMDVLAGVQCSTQYEAEAEMDDSKVPAALKDWIGAGCKILRDMVAEETAELMRVERPATTKRDEPALEPAPKAPVVAPDPEIAKRDEQIAALAKRLKALEDQPLPPKGPTRTVVIDKVDDVSGQEPSPSIPAVKNADGTVDAAATEVKKIHAAGPVPLGAGRVSVWNRPRASGRS